MHSSRGSDPLSALRAGFFCSADLAICLFNPNAERHVSGPDKVAESPNQRTKTDDTDLDVNQLPQSTDPRRPVVSKIFRKLREIDFIALPFSAFDGVQIGRLQSVDPALMLGQRFLGAKDFASRECNSIYDDQRAGTRESLVADRQVEHEATDCKRPCAEDQK